MKVNNSYLGREIKNQINQFFEDNGYLQLQDFLDEDVERLRSEIEEENFQKVYIPDIMKRSELKLQDLTEIVDISFIDFFKSKEFLNFMEDVTQREVMLKDFKVCKYEHKDFVLINDKVQRDDCFDVFFDFSYNDWEDDFGGTHTYLTSEEEVFYLKPELNTFTIVSRDESILNYLKYVNNHAKDKKIFRIEMKFEII